VTAKHIRLYREHAAKCRDLARMIDTLRQRLMDVAMECGDRPREAETLEECRQSENGTGGSGNTGSSGSRHAVNQRGRRRLRHWTLDNLQADK
jgi:hypothetical protein